jgi:hypothetical protein
MRFLYSCLLRLHPRRFRERFAEEMMNVFDEARGTLGTGRLLADAIASLVRQWMFRPEQQPVPASAAKVSSEVAMFHTFDTYKPGRIALAQGAALSAIFFGALLFAANNGARPLRFLIGSHDPRPSLFSVTRSSIESAVPDATVRVPQPVADPWYDFASHYFKIIYVLDALDANHDYVISASEIAVAPAALRKLDVNGDGKLTAEECGMRTSGSGSLRAVFMRANPVLAALDTDHNAEISATEIQNAPAGLERLDLNGDGKLLPVEVAPDSVARKILMSGK